MFHTVRESTKGGVVKGGLVIWLGGRDPGRESVWVPLVVVFTVFCSCAGSWQRLRVIPPSGGWTATTRLTRRVWRRPSDAACGLWRRGMLFWDVLWYAILGRPVVCYFGKGNWHQSGMLFWDARGLRSGVLFPTNSPPIFSTSLHTYLRFPPSALPCPSLPHSPTASQKSSPAPKIPAPNVREERGVVQLNLFGVVSAVFCVRFRHSLCFFFVRFLL